MENMLVRFIPTDRSSRVGWTGSKPSLCFGDKKTNRARCVVIRETDIGTVDLPLDVVEKSSIVNDPDNPAAPYSAERFIKRITETGKPLTEEARALLESIKPSKGKKKAALPPNKPKPPPARASVGKTAPVLKTAGAEIIISLAAEWKLPSPKLRRFLRGQGLRAPYTDEKLLRTALKKLKKGK